MAKLLDYQHWTYVSWDTCNMPSICYTRISIHHSLTQRNRSHNRFSLEKKTVTVNKFEGLLTNFIDLLRDEIILRSVASLLEEEPHVGDKYCRNTLQHQHLCHFSLCISLENAQPLVKCWGMWWNQWVSLLQFALFTRSHIERRILLRKIQPMIMANFYISKN